MRRFLSFSVCLSHTYTHTNTHRGALGHKSKAITLTFTVLPVVLEQVVRGTHTLEVIIALVHTLVFTATIFHRTGNGRCPTYTHTQPFT